MWPFHREVHRVDRVGWLRAAVLGANDGLISTASLIVGVAAASTSRSEVLVAGIAGLVAGAMSMAAGEYVSVSSQADTEEADLTRERRELAEQPEVELNELAHIYVQRGVQPELARKVAQQMMAKDAFAAHARDELGRRKRRPKEGTFLRSIGIHTGLARSRSGCGCFSNDFFKRANLSGARSPTRPRSGPVGPCLREAIIARQAMVKRPCGWPNWTEFLKVTCRSLLDVSTKHVAWLFYKRLVRA